MNPFDFSYLPEDPGELEEYVHQKEQSISNLKEGNDARIVWADPGRKDITPLSVVYLHGFTASRGEGAPLHVNFARRYHLNLYLSRLAGHGLDTIDAFNGLTSGKLIRSAAEAVEIGKRLGQQVIIMGTSTGASLALYLASVSGENQTKGLILYAPLIDFYGIKSLLLTHSATRRILKTILSNRFILTSTAQSAFTRKVWYDRYRLEGALALGKFIETHMRDNVFNKVTLPAFIGYYYKNRRKQDTIVSVRAIQHLFDTLGTPEEAKKLVNFPDAGTHVICNKFLSKAFDRLQQKTFEYSEKVLGLNPLEKS